MPQPRRYSDPTSVVGVRLPEASRRTLEWVAVTSGAPNLSHYLRCVLEDHLRSLGFNLVVGRTAQLPLPPPPEVVAAYQAEQERADGQEPDRAVG